MKRIFFFFIIKYGPWACRARTLRRNHDLVDQQIYGQSQLVHWDFEISEPSVVSKQFHIYYSVGICVSYCIEKYGSRCFEISELVDFDHMFAGQPGRGFVSKSRPGNPMVHIL